VKVNVTIWEDQLRLFQEAAKLSPTGRISYVVANAGMIKSDSVYHVSGTDEPHKPDLQILEVNIIGAMYTTKLALHYFVKRNGTVESADQDDTSLILMGSGASFLDGPRAPQYQASKWAMRGLLHSLRRTAFFHGTRVNMIAPWYIRPSILSEEIFNDVAKAGVEFARLEDAQSCLLRILSDTSINGRSLFIGARKWKAEGYWDLDVDDYHSNPVVEQIQQEQMWSEPVSKGLFPS
jgi:NAD(P)-dependent dehydrogenase (short-subunit alcohol dehydrogenase family)